MATRSSLVVFSTCVVTGTLSVAMVTEQACDLVDYHSTGRQPKT